MKKGNSDTFVAADMVKEHSKKRPFYEQIDELYTPLLRTTQFKLEENVDPRSRGERLGEEYLENVSHLNHYITDKIIAYIYDKIIKPEQKD
ncbi:MAG: hypothetical protein LBO09_07375 [Candidatus Peribacteria bacterium]|nr:hypothetical protein [Candidatus Peribacteria bacterium]